MTRKTPKKAELKSRQYKYSGPVTSLSIGGEEISFVNGETYTLSIDDIAVKRLVAHGYLTETKENSDA